MKWLGKKTKSNFDLKSSQHCYLYWQVNAVVLQRRTRSVCSSTSLHPSDLWDAGAHRLPLNLTILCLKRWMFNPRPQSVGSGRWISPGCACVFCSYAKMSVWVPVSEVFFFFFLYSPRLRSLCCPAHVLQFVFSNLWVWMCLRVCA